VTDVPELPPPGPALSRRLEAVATRYLLDRFVGPGNPMRTQVLQLGMLTATKVPFLPRNALMNAVHGLEDPADLPRVLAFYAETQQPCWVELSPHADPSVTRALQDEGFKRADRKAVLYGFAQPRPPSDPTIEITTVTAEELDPFLDTLNQGFGAPTEMLPGARRNQSFWRDIAHWRLYLARLDGQAAGAAVLTITDDVAYLAASATLPAFRRRGVHEALISRRLADAAAAKCKLATGQAAFDTPSHRNQERAGLQLAHIRQDWTNA
jgi:GNAT superfamily N-acetyltransferase